jgi:hypothetical protein
MTPLLVVGFPRGRASGRSGRGNRYARGPRGDCPDLQGLKGFVEENLPIFVNGRAKIFQEVGTPR